MTLLHVLAFWLGWNIWLVLWGALRDVAQGVKDGILAGYGEPEESFNGYLPPRAGERS